VKSEGSWLSLIAISPALLFVPLMSVFRGYFQGMQEMRPTAVSQLTEQAVRVAVGLALAAAFVSGSLEKASAGACLGASIGPVAGLIILALVYRRMRGGAGWPKEAGKAGRGEDPPSGERETAGAILKSLVALTVPTTIGISILPIMNVVDMLLCRIRLIDGGYSPQAAEGLYGLMAGFAAPIINVPMALALSIALSMVPAIAAAASTGDRDFLGTNVKMGLRAAMIIGVPCSFGLITLATPIMWLIYPAQRAGAGVAASCLAVLGAGVIFLCVAQAMAGILQGLGRVSLPVVSLIVGLAAKTALTYALTALPSLNINGAALGSTLGYAAIGIMNLVFVKRITGVRFDFRLSVVKPALSGLAMCVVVLAVYFAVGARLGNSLAAAAAICAGALAYAVTVLKSKAVTAEEIALLPKGAHIAGLLRRLRLV
jgi:stage V sporulation protein B